MTLMKPVRDVGVVGYGAYVPRFRLPGAEVSRVWSGGCSMVAVREKAVAGLDEDVVTMSVEAARNAVCRAQIDPSRIGAVWVGSESHPYAAKPSSTIVAEAIGAGPYTLAADWQFACKGGTEAVQGAIGLVGSCAVEYALAIGMDTAQARPGDVLEYTAGSGGAALIIGPADEAVAVLEGSLSVATDTPDFWRRAHEQYPQHGGRFTGDMGYFKHVLRAGGELMRELGAAPQDYQYAVFHQPNVKFPSTAGKELGFTRKQIDTGLLANEVGNTYAGAALLGLTAVLDVCQPGERILVVSYGSGAGSDAFSWRVPAQIPKRFSTVPTTRQYVDRRVELDYARYARFRGKYTLR
jgi:hydroxymethylglutaryl-CoA synthase